MTLFSVSAHDIDTAGLAVETDLPLAWLKEELADANLEGRAPGHFRGRLSRSGGEIVVRGALKVELTTPCARCLDPATISVDTELTLLLRAAPGEHHARPSDGGKGGKKPNGHGPKPAAKEPKEPEEYEFTSAEADVDTYDGETVVLDPFFREAILLEIPNFPLCSEACPGIGAAAHAPEPEPSGDPRLRPLRALREKLAAARPRPEGDTTAQSSQRADEARSNEPPEAREKPKKKKE
jgi:uncharacterized protein